MPKVNFDIPLDFLQTKTPPLIGVDIGTSSVKMVELSQLPKNAGYMVERYAIEPLPRDAVSDGNINNLDAVSESLRRAWKRLGGKIKNVSLALPAGAVITKKILLPAGLREEDLEYQVESEANQYIPFALDEVNLDFQVLGLASGNAEELEVLPALLQRLECVAEFEISAVLHRPPSGRDRAVREENESRPQRRAGGSGGQLPGGRGFGGEQIQRP